MNPALQSFIFILAVITFCFASVSSGSIVNEKSVDTVRSGHQTIQKVSAQDREAVKESDGLSASFDGTSVWIEDETESGDLDPKTDQLVKLNEPSVRTGRQDFVRGLRDEIYRRYGGRYNVIAFNIRNAYSYSVSGRVHKSDRSYGAYKYRVIAFRSGWFHNKGDGGYINWAFRGRWKRNGMVVRFY